MVSRILPFTLTAAWVAAATPAHAWDPFDPSGPPPDDPSAWRNSERGPARIAQDLKRCDMRFADDSSGLALDDPSAHKTDRGLECSCDMRACAQPKGSPRSEVKAKQQPDPATDSPG